MILSLRHNYIYIRTKKTGSTTIEELLTQNLGPEDVVIRRDFEVLRPLLKPGAELPKREKLSNAPTSPTHVGIDRIQPLIREDFWRNAFKFTSERHPYEKAVSFAYWRWWNTRRGDQRQNPSGDEFQQHLDKMVRHGKYPSFPLYSIEGKSVVDDFVRLETMLEDIQRVTARIGISPPASLPHTRTESRVDRRPARETLSEAQREIVWQRCRPEFELLSYPR
ncbi:MAG: hypothetical protein JOY77_07980 [Alphaproteobacteria bacterium]|nr:hypothetical protein [Alphaproteobacteria bacterium]